MAFAKEDMCEVPGCFREKQAPHLSCSICASMFDRWKALNPEGSFEDWKNGPGMIERDHCHCGGNIRPLNEDWAACNKCGDDTFPLSILAAGGVYVTEMEPPEPVAGVELEGTLNGEPMTGFAFGDTAGIFMEREIDRLKGIIEIQKLQLGLCDCNHYAEENKRLRGYAEMWKKLARRIRVREIGEVDG